MKIQRMNSKCFIMFFTFLLGSGFLQLATADCIKTYMDKIAKNKEIDTLKKILFSGSKYELALNLITDSINKVQSKTFLNFSKKVTKFYTKTNRIVPTAEELMVIIEGLNKNGILCNPKPVAYSVLAKNFATYHDALMVEIASKKQAKGQSRQSSSDVAKKRSTTEQESSLAMKKLAIKRMGPAYEEVQNCSPYKNIFATESEKLKRLAVDSSVPAVFASETFSCSICYDEKPVGDFCKTQACDCKNQLITCKDCSKRYYQGTLTSGSYPNKCMFCKGKLNAAELQEQGILTEDEVTEWQFRELREAAMSIPGYTKCDKDGCYNGYFNSEKAFKKYTTDGCSVCGTKAKPCTDCGRDAHPSKSCGQVWGDWVDECKKFGATACPNCWSRIQHGGACMHMKCTQCGTEYSEITKLPLVKEGTAFEDHDVGGWPIKYFYPNGKRGGRRDQNGRLIDAYGNLIVKVSRPIEAEVVDDRGRVSRRMVNYEIDTVVSADGREFFDYEPLSNSAWKLDPKNKYKKVSETPIPIEQHEKFKGKWDAIVAKIVKENAKARRK